MGRMKDLGQQLTEKLEAYANLQEARNSVQNMVVQGGGYSGQGLYGQAIAGASKMRKAPPVVDNPNQREAYVIPLSTLANMWRAKYGDLWVDVPELDDEFWSDASSRLHRNKLMEEIEFRESNTPWARLKEGA